MSDIEFIPTIDNRIPIPPRRGHKPNTPHRTENQMRLPLLDHLTRPGQSMFVPASIITVDNLRNRASQTTARSGIRFTVYECIEEKVPGARIWRRKNKA